MSDLEIWLVNDDPAQLLVQKRLLGRVAATVWDFQSPTELIAQAKKYGSCPNLVSDYNMPGLNGMQLSQMWCEMHPDAKVLLLSASQMSDSERDELTYLPKSHVKVLTDFRLPELLSTAREWFTCEPSSEHDSIESAEATDPSRVYRLFETDTLRKLSALGGGPFVKKALERFAARVPLRFQTLTAALENQRVGLIVEEAHSFKGSCGVVGAHTMMNIAGQLEVCARNDSELPVLRSLVNDLETAWQGTEEELRSILQELC